MTGIPNLVGFCEAIMEYWPEGAPDGGDLQELAIKHGLLREETRHAFCDADEDADAGACACREICDIHDLKRGFTCCTRVPLTPPSAPAASPEAIKRAIIAYHAAIAEAYDKQDDDAPPMGQEFREYVGMRAVLREAASPEVMDDLDAALRNAGPTLVAIARAARGVRNHSHSCRTNFFFGTDERCDCGARDLWQALDALAALTPPQPNLKERADELPGICPTSLARSPAVPSPLWPRILPRTPNSEDASAETRQERTQAMSGQDEGAVEALCAIVTPAHEFRKLGLLLDRSAVQSQEDARAILAAIRDGKVPGVNSQATTDAVAHTVRTCSEQQYKKEIDDLRAQLAAAKAEGERVNGFMRRLHMAADLGPDGNSYLIISEAELNLLVAASDADPADAKLVLDAYVAGSPERNELRTELGRAQSERDALAGLLRLVMTTCQVSGIDQAVRDRISAALAGKGGGDGWVSVEEPPKFRDPVWCATRREGKPTVIEGRHDHHGWWLIHDGCAYSFREYDYEPPTHWQEIRPPTPPATPTKDAR